MCRACWVLIGALGTCLAATAAPPAGPRFDSIGDPLPEGAIARLGTTRLWTPLPLQMVLFSPDGKLLVGGDANGTLRMWEAASGKPIRQRDGAPSAKTPAAIAPDGKFLYVFSNPCCQLWDPTTGKTSELWNEAEQNAYFASYSPNGKTLAVALSKGEVVLLEAASGKVSSRIELPGEPPTVHALTFSQDSRLLAISFQGGNVWLWDCVRGKRIRWFHSGSRSRDQPVVSVAFHPDGRSLAVAAQVGDKHIVKRFEMDSDNEVETWTPADAEAVRALRYSSDGKKLFGISAMGSLLHWDTATWKLLKPLRVGVKPVLAVTFDPAGQTAVLMRERQIEMIDALTGKPRFPFRNFPPLGSANFTGKSGDVVGVADDEGGFHFWDATTGRLQHSLNSTPREGGSEPNFKRFALCPDGKSLVAWAGELQGFRIIEAKEGKEVWTAPAEDAIECVAISPDGRQLAAVPAERKTVEVWDLKTRRRRRSIPLEPLMGEIKLAWSPDGRSLAAIADGEPGFIWEVETGQLRHRFEIRIPQALTYLYDGRRLAITSGIGPVVLVRPGSDEKRQFVLPDVSLTVVAASSDGRWLAVGNEEGRVFLHDLRNGKQHDLPGHAAPVRSVAFAQDSSRLVSASEDGTALVWDLKALPERARQATKAMSLRACWEALALSDAIKAARAKATFEDRPEEAVAFLKENAVPARPVDAERLAHLLKVLDSSNFQARQKAIRELEELGPRIEKVLRDKAANAAGLEMRKRLDLLLEKIDGPLTHPETLRAVRVVEILEGIGSPAARSLLESLSTGDAAARPTHEVHAALERLKNRALPSAKDP